jgi:CubicO group peptidase (beta-lactamase class C family)
MQPETRTVLWTSQETSAGESTGYGIGWSVGTDEAGNRFVGHTGGSVGGTTFLRIYPDKALVLAVIANVSSAPFQGLPVAIADLFLTEVEP